MRRTSSTASPCGSKEGPWKSPLPQSEADWTIAGKGEASDAVELP